MILHRSGEATSSSASRGWDENLGSKVSRVVGKNHHDSCSIPVRADDHRGLKSFGPPFWETFLGLVFCGVWFGHWCDLKGGASMSEHQDQLNPLDRTTHTSYLITHNMPWSPIPILHAVILNDLMRLLIMILIILNMDNMVSLHDSPPLRHSNRLQHQQRLGWKPGFWDFASC